LAINTIKTYKCCIRKLTEKLSDAQKAECLESNGRLIKSLEGNVASHIVHLNQIKSNIDGMIVFKSRNILLAKCFGFKYWHTESNRLRPRGAESITLGPETELMLKTYMSGNRRIIVQQRADGNGDADPGKMPVNFSFSGYRMLVRCALFHAKTAKQTLLVHSYVILCWNLMARSNTVFSLL
jgi:hypothetical protein